MIPEALAELAVLDGGAPLFTNILDTTDKQTRQERSLDVNHDELAAELVRLDRVIKELRRVRAAATYDLEWALKEQARVKTPSSRE